MTAPTKARRKVTPVTDEITDTMIKATPAKKAAPKKIVTPEVIEQAKAKRVMISHEACDHPRTPAGRAICRQARKDAAAA